MQGLVRFRQNTGTDVVGGTVVVVVVAVVRGVVVAVDVRIVGVVVVTVVVRTMHGPGTH